MHLARLKLRDFRNYPRMDAEFAPGFHVILGNNAQGKTNLLEAIYLLATLRSFRGVGNGQLVRLGQTGFFVGATVLGPAEREIKMYWSVRERKLSLDGQPVRRLHDYLGVVRTVVFCTDDTQLVKGPPRSRRRYLDLLLSQTRPGYLGQLQRYAQVLRSRNALLKQRICDAAALDGFSNELVHMGNLIIQQRRELLPQLAPLAREAYRRIAQTEEDLLLEYLPSVRQDLAVELAQSRARELAMRATLIGPHRDDLMIQIEGKDAAQFASEGQKRSIAIALKMAQAELLTSTHGAPPILLIDDVMGELDLHRRSGFIPLLHDVQRARSQVFMTCTEENWPRELGRQLHRWTVSQGVLRSQGEVTR
jgi:DNA replication and repair protein RecF